LVTIFKKNIRKKNAVKLKKIIRISRFLVLAVLIGCGVFTAFNLTDTYNLVSLSGLGTLIIVCVLLSNNPAKINWHILIAGIEVQFILGVVLLKTEFGYQLFDFVSKQVTTFLAYTNKGTSLVFGEKYTDHPFAFQSIPVIVFFGATIK
jgi:pyrimidine nucleoside transport protein